MKFCHTCDWFVDDADGTERERSRRALEHFVETGHSIDSSDSVGRPMPPSICEELLVRDLAREFDGSESGTAHSD